MIQTTCPECSTPYRLADELAGKRIKCKRCGHVFAVRAAAPARSGAKPAQKPVAKPAAPPPPAAPLVGPEAVLPYAIKPPEEVPESAKDNRIDQMVRTAERQKRRNRAWLKVGMPATWLKWATLILLFLNTMLFLWWTMACILMAHKWEQKYVEHKDRAAEKMKGERWLFPLDEFGFEYDDAVPFVWGLACAFYFPLAILYGFTLAGAESMRRLENYRWAMAGAILGIFVFPPLGLLCVTRLMDKEVQYEFEISKMRREGIDWETLEDEAEAAEAEEDEDEEDDEELEDEEEEEAAPRKRRR